MDFFIFIGGDDEEAEEPSLEEKEIEAMKLLFNQGRLAERGATEMVLTQITACKGQAGDMMENTLTLGKQFLHISKMYFCHYLTICVWLKRIK